MHSFVWQAAPLAACAYPVFTLCSATPHHQAVLIRKHSYVLETNLIAALCCCTQCVLQMTLSELRLQLESRSLDLSGSKAVLEMRLAQALVIEIVGPEAAGAMGNLSGQQAAGAEEVSRDDNLSCNRACAALLVASRAICVASKRQQVASKQQVLSK
jgi:hypothetical protein